MEKQDRRSLHREIEAYLILGEKHFLPKQYDSMKWNGRLVMAMESLDKSLDQCFNWCRDRGRVMAVKDAVQIAIDLIDAFQYIHGKKYLHRDIKPGNVMIRSAGSGKYVVVVVDWGCAAKTWKRRHNRCHRVGTPRFMAIRAHKKRRQRPHDDMEAIAYMVMSFLKPHMPWDSITAPTPQEKNRKIMDVKMKTPLHELLANEGNYPDIPVVFGKFLKETKFVTNRYKIKVGPLYMKWKKSFTDFAESNRINLDNKYTWSAPGSWSH
jgi:casein kinase I family protein HRR25